MYEQLYMYQKLQDIHVYSVQYIPVTQVNTSVPKKSTFASDW